MRKVVLVNSESSPYLKTIGLIVATSALAPSPPAFPVRAIKNRPASLACAHPCADPLLCLHPGFQPSQPTPRFPTGPPNLLTSWRAPLVLGPTHCGGSAWAWPTSGDPLPETHFRLDGAPFRGLCLVSLPYCGFVTVVLLCDAFYLPYFLL